MPPFQPERLNLQALEHRRGLWLPSSASYAGVPSVPGVADSLSEVDEIVVQGLQPGTVGSTGDWNMHGEGLLFSSTDCPPAEMQGDKVPHLTDFLIFLKSRCLCEISQCFSIFAINAKFP